jgi:hypothetical protein
VALGESDPVAAGRRRGPDGHPLTLGQLDRRLPAAGGVDLGTGDEHRALGGPQALGERGDLFEALADACELRRPDEGVPRSGVSAGDNKPAGYR